MSVNLNQSLSYSVEEFANILNQQKLFALPAYQKLQITGLDTESCQEPINASSDLKLNAIKNIFNQFLQQHNLQVDTFSQKGVLVYNVTEPGTISIVSDQPLHIQARSIDVFTPFRAIPEGVSQILSKQHLVLTDLSPRETQSFMDPASSSMTYCELKERIEKLSPKMLKQWVADLDQLGRKELLKVLKQSNSEHPLNSKARVLAIKLERTHILPIRYTQKDMRRLGVLQLVKKMCIFIDLLLSKMGYLSVKRTCTLFKEFLLPQVPENTCSEDQLLNIIREEKEKLPGSRIDLKAVLEQHGYSSTISSCCLSFRDELHNVNLEGISFVDCTLDWTPLTGVHLNHVTFHGCKLLNVSFMNAVLKNCSFIHCHIREAMFTNARLEDVQFISSSILGSSFEDACLINTQFDHVRMGATHFCQAQVESSRFVASCVKDTVFFGTLEHFTLDEETRQSATISAPVVALIVPADARGVANPKVYQKLEHAAEVIPIRITARNQQADIAAINQEVTEALDAIGPNNRDQLPIPQQLLQRILENPEEFPESVRILRKAKSLASEVDSFFLPGGEDIPPRLYGQEPIEKTHWGNDYRYALLELAMIRQSVNQGIPLMGICRGFQMASIYFGAELEQHVPGQIGVQKFTPIEGDLPGIYDQMIGESITSTVYHHQAVPQDKGPTQALRPSVIYQNWIKAAEPADTQTAPMILLQFHPEFRDAPTANTIGNEITDRSLTSAMSPQNEHFWKMLAQSAQVRYAKRQLRAALTHHPLVLRTSEEVAGA